ncbi:MAG: AAA family ATPase [Alphaproteobacteria bacterium]|nr:AAA family ATPase [Alphaproteobacteria bacterium]
MSQPDSISDLATITGRARVVVIGNEKGGTGKSTTAMHLIVGAMREGARVASIDLDSGQASLTRYVTNRQAFAEEHRVSLVIPEHHRIVLSDSDSRADAAKEDIERLSDELMRLSENYDVIFVDSPAGDSSVARGAMAFADTLVTPVNDSFIDLDLLVRLEGDPPQPKGPSRYSEAVWEQRKVRASSGGDPIDWVVLRNRIASLSSRNQVSVAEILDELSQSIGFRIADGFGERVVYRELFVQGLTVLDLREVGAGVSLSMSHLAARQEVRRLLDFIGLAGQFESENQAAS